jgi:hypothetical protein
MASRASLTPQSLQAGERTEGFEGQPAKARAMAWNKVRSCMVALLAL